jgi:hypothetical protein
MVLGGGAAVAANGLDKNSVGTPQLKKNAVKTAKIGPGAVKTGKLGKEAVKAGKLANGAVVESKIGDAAVTSGKLAVDSVLTDKIAKEAVTGEKVNESTLGEVPLAAEAKKSAGPAGGALAGTYPNPTIAAKAVKGANFAASGTFTLNPGSIAANSCEYELPTVPGATNTPTSTTIVEPPEQIAAAGVSATAMRSNSNNLIRLLFCNPTAAPIDPPNGTYTYLVIAQ